MSGTQAAAKPIIARTAAADLFESVETPPERLPWPAAGLLVLLLSAGLWFGIGLALSRVLG